MINYFSIFYKFIVHHLELFEPQYNASSKLPHILKPQLQTEAQRAEPAPNTFVPSNSEYQQQNNDKKPKYPLSQTANTNQDGECAENIRNSPKVRQGFESTRDVQSQYRNKKYGKKRGCTKLSAEKIKRKKRRLECKRNQNSSYTSEIENVSLYTCMQCRKKVRSKGKLEHAVKHYQHIFLTDPINSSDNSHSNIDELICTKPGCGYNYKSTVDLARHCGIDHGGLEDHLKKIGKTLADLYMTKKPKSSNVSRGKNGIDMTSDHNHASNKININRKDSKIIPKGAKHKNLKTTEAIFDGDTPVQTQHFGDRTSTLGPSKGKSLDPKEAKDVESDLEIKLSLCVSDISSDSLYDPDDNIDLGLQIPKGLRPARNSNIASTEIDTEAETDKEDVI